MVVNQLIIKLKNTIIMEITKNKITEIFCIIDDFCQEYDKEIARMSICEPDGRKHRNRKWTMSRSEIMTILIYFRKRLRDASIYTSKKYRSSSILERYFFVSIYPAASHGTFLAVFLVAVLLLC